MNSNSQDSSIHAIHRSELLTSINMLVRDTVIQYFLEMWQKIYKDESISKVKWLQTFQLGLKNVKTLTDEDIYSRLKCKKRILSCVYDCVMLTAKLYHDGAEPHVVKERPLIYYFVKNLMILKKF